MSEQLPELVPELVPDLGSPALADGDAIADQAPFDGTPSDPTEDNRSPRIPHLGHALLFGAITALSLMLAVVVFFGLNSAPRGGSVHTTQQINPRLTMLAMTISYIVTLAASFGIFPILWRRSFLSGIRWRWSVAKHQYYKLIPLGFVLGLVVQAGSSLLPTPKSMPMDQFFRTQTDVWIATAFGTLLAPVFEEIAFRGFLLPAFAIAYDWLSLKRTPEVRRLWQTTTNLSRMAYVFATVLTSLVFALLHAAQLGDAWSAVAVLFLVSVILCIVRLRTGSVAASAMVHACYNFAVFVMIFIGTGGYRHLDRLSH